MHMGPRWAAGKNHVHSGVLLEKRRQVHSEQMAGDFMKETPDLWPNI